MRLYETFQMAIKNILSSKLRTFLTMLGIIIGVMSVIVIVGFGNGMAGYMTDSFASMGTNTLTVSVMGRGTSRTLSVDQMYEIVDENTDYFQKVSPTVSMSGTVKIGTETDSSTSSMGVSEDYLSIKDYAISQGRGIQYVDISDRKSVCVVGNYIAQTYYGGDAVGEYLKIGALKLKIIGVMEQQSDEMEEGGTDDCVYLPYSTAARSSGTGTISSYTLMLADENQASEATTLLENELYKIFSDSDAYKVTSMSEMLETMTSMINVIVAILAVIAGISLVVGGIGIMNIMLVSVTERTREIGIRKALGAREAVILRQFVIEAATTSALGGVIGILLGYGISAIATKVATAMMESSITIAPSVTAVLISFGISAGIGILFGYLPARKAARLNPIEALRHD